MPSSFLTVDAPSFVSPGVMGGELLARCFLCAAVTPFRGQCGRWAALCVASLAFQAVWLIWGLWVVRAAHRE